MKESMDLKKFDLEYYSKRIQLFTLNNSEGLEIQITNFGGRIVSLFTPDKNGILEDIVLGYDNIDDYLNKEEVFFGAIIGRYGNRIAHGKFNIDNLEYTLETNSENSKNHLHGGTNGFHNVVWDAKQVSKTQLELSHFSKENEAGYPGNLKVTILYELTDLNELKITYSATTDKKTILNLTHHSYFNLTGKQNSNILKHHIKIYASNFTPINNLMIPTGKIESVTNSPLEFKTFQTIGSRINADDDQIEKAHGYDHNYVIDGSGLKKAADVYDPNSKRTLEVFTTEPGIQFYTGNHLNNIKGKYNDTYHANAAFCLEPQHFPDSPNQPHFPSTIIKPEETYNSTTIYKFGVKI